MVMKNKNLIKKEIEAQRSLSLRARFSIALMFMHIKYGDPDKGRKKMMLDQCVL